MNKESMQHHQINVIFYLFSVKTIYSPFKVDSLWLDTVCSVIMFLDTAADASYFDLEQYLQPLIVH
jgi:hypothetical protein